MEFGTRRRKTVLNDVHFLALNQDTDQYMVKTLRVIKRADHRVYGKITERVNSPYIYRRLLTGY
jgi:hypothetical protein